MNPIILTTVTVLANAIVTGIIVYLIQKKIESSYSKKLEEFRASLQYSIFEQQTKFAKVHPKRVKIIENLYKKFMDFDQALDEWILESGFGRFKKSRINMVDYNIQKSENVREKLEGFWNYCEANRLFLPANLINQIWDIYHKASGSHSDVSVLLIYDSDDITSVSTEKDSTFLDSEQTELLLAQSYLKVKSQTEKLEEIYKSVADTTDRENNQ